MNKLKILSAFAFALAFAGMSFAADEKIIDQYGAITIKKVMVERQVNGQNTQVEWKVAYIDDSSDETPVITEDIKVDSVYYSRVFKFKVASTLMLPFDVPTWKLSGLSAFEFVSIEKYSDHFQIEVRSTYVNEFKANTPYIIMNEQKDTTISFNMTDVNPNNYVTINTTTNTRNHSFSSGGYNWTVAAIIGLSLEHTNA